MQQPPITTRPLPHDAKRGAASQHWHAAFCIAVVFCLVNFSTLLCLLGHDHAPERSASPIHLKSFDFQKKPKGSSEKDGHLVGDHHDPGAHHADWACDGVAGMTHPAGSAALARHAHGVEGLFEKPAPEALVYWSVRPG